MIIPALSIKQPWAWAIVEGHKPVENREWKNKPRYRGPLLIHASKNYDKTGAAWIGNEFPELKIPNLYVGNGMGGIVGIVWFKDIVTYHKSPWFFGPLGLVVDDAKPLPFYPCKGQLGFFNVNYPGSLLNDSLKGNDYERFF